MIGSDLQSKASVDLDQGLRGLRQMRSEFQALGLEIRKTNAAARDMQKNLQVPKTEGNQARKGFGAAQKVGGKVGAQFGVLSASEGMGSFGRIAIAAAGLAAGVQVASTVINKITEDTRDIATRRLGLEKDLLAATEKRQDAALAAAGGVGGRERLVAAGGDGAVDLRDRLTKAGVGSKDEVTNGLITILGTLGNSLRAGDTIDAAMRARGAGVPFDQAATELTPMSHALSDPSTAEVVVGRLVKKHLGRVRGDPVQILRQAEGSIASDPVLSGARKVGSIGAATDAINEGRVGTEAEAAARRRMGQTVSPEAAMLTNRHLENSRTVQVLEEIRDIFRDRMKENTFADAPISNITLRIAEALAEHNLNRELRIQGQSFQKRP